MRGRPPRRRAGDVEKGNDDGRQRENRVSPRAGGVERRYNFLGASPRQSSSPPSARRPTKKQSRNVSGRTRARSHPPSVMPASAGTRASSEVPVMASGSAPYSASPPASAKVETVNDKSSACTRSSRSSPSEPR